MIVKKTITLSLFLFFSITIFGQKNEFNLIQLDSTWGQEVLRFPARNMNYIGVGEVRFPPNGWINPKHQNFWSYTYAWKIDVNKEILNKELEIDLVKYFNSLNRIKMNDKSNPKYSTANINKTTKEGNIVHFNGTVKIFDRFATNKMIILNVKTESHYCKKEKRTVLLFKFSPKDFKHKTWEMLEKVQLHSIRCN